MSNRFVQELNLFQQPVWLWASVLALIPIISLRLRPQRFINLPSGWNASSLGTRTTRFHWQVIKYILSFIILLCMTLALAMPNWPVFQDLEPMKKGHHWSVVLDCSGSMAQVDQTQNVSRLERLTDALENAIRKRPNDRFSLIRVAGFADQIGPSSTNTEFLIQQLKQIQPALPGEDGTSLADGIILAANALREKLSLNNNNNNNKADGYSILLLSDGRDNPPDTSSQSLSEIVGLMTRLNIKVNWLKLELPENPDESKDSKARALQAARLLEELTINTGGEILTANENEDWTAITETVVMGTTQNKENTTWTSAAVFIMFLTSFAIILYFMIDLISGIGNQSSYNHILIVIRQHYHFPRFLNTLFILIAFGLILTTIFSIYNSKLTEFKATHPEKYATHYLQIAFDVSPSMSAKDTVNGPRLETAKRIANAMIGAASISDHTVIQITPFSGRSLVMTPWTNNWSGIQETVDGLYPRQIRPDGSDWHNLFESILKSDEQIKLLNQSNNLTRTVIILTDGEASEDPDDQQLKQFINSGIKPVIITLGNDKAPGILFSTSSNDSQFWLNPATQEPARTHRTDTLARKIADLTGGEQISVGSSDFQEFQLAKSLIPVQIMKSDRNHKSPDISIRLFILALILWTFRESVILFRMLKTRKVRSILVLIFVLPLQACTHESPWSRITQFIKYAETARNQGDFVQAQAYLQQAMMIDSSNPYAEYHLALLKLDQNENDSALKLFSSCSEKLRTEINSGQSQRRILKLRSESGRGYTLATLGRWQGAETCFSALLKDSFINITLDVNEIHQIVQNLDYVREMKHKIQSNPETTQPNSTDAIPDSKSDVFPQKVISTDQEFKNRVTKAQNRSRKARSTFDQAGDIILGPLPMFENRNRMNW